MYTHALADGLFMIADSKESTQLHGYIKTSNFEDTYDSWRSFDILGWTLQELPHVRWKDLENI